MYIWMDVPWMVLFWSPWPQERKLLLCPINSRMIVLWKRVAFNLPTVVHTAQGSWLGIMAPKTIKVSQKLKTKKVLHATNASVQGRDWGRLHCPVLLLLWHLPLLFFSVYNKKRLDSTQKTEKRINRITFKSRTLYKCGLFWHKKRLGCTLWNLGQDLGYQKGWQLHPQ